VRLGAQVPFVLFFGKSPWLSLSCPRIYPLYRYCSESKMAEEEGDYVFQASDAGASATIPMEAGQIKKGG
jgi:hypothetical protein